MKFSVSNLPIPRKVGVKSQFTAFLSPYTFLKLLDSFLFTPTRSIFYMPNFFFFLYQMQNQSDHRKRVGAFESRFGGKKQSRLLIDELVNGLSSVADAALPSPTLDHLNATR